MPHDAIVVGGSYAGMSAALQLVRARRDVLVIDAGLPRNRFAAHAHGFLGQDGTAPAEIARRARDQLRAYPTLAWTEATAERVEPDGDGFAVLTADGARHRARRLILATGVSDVLPEVPGLAERWGRGVYHCPYCHAYELGRGPLGVLATGPESLHQALLLPDWGPVTFFLNGVCEPEEGEQARLAARGVAIEATRVAGLRGEADVALADGREVRLAGLFTTPRTRPNGRLGEDLGCAFREDSLGRFLRVDDRQETTVRGVFACGDAACEAGSISLAVGHGAFAGGAAHASLVFG
jgi:thioredoxin reductase